MTSYTFADLVGDEKTFIEDYLNTKPMLRKNAIPGDSRDLLSIRKLDELANLEVVRPPYIKVNLKGEGVPEKGYSKNVVIQGQTVTDIVDPEKLYALYRAGATITWSSINQVTPELRDFTRLISAKMAVRTDTVVFLTPAGKKGYPPHHDPVDLFIVQTEGTKHWKIWNPIGVRQGGNAQYTEADLGEPAIEVSLQPGDVLYLPYNTPHAAAAEGSASVHLSIMMRPRMWKDLLRQTVEELIQDIEFNEYPHIGELRAPAVESTYKDKIASLARRLETVEVSPELDRLAELGRTMDGSSQGTTFQTISEMDAMGPSSQLRRTELPVEFGQNDSGRTQLAVNGNKIMVPTAVAEKLAALEADTTLAASEVFPGVDPARSTKTAQGLTRLGLFELSAS